MNLLRNIAKSAILYYLKLSAKIQLLKIRPKIIGVGGSSGKTSTAGFIELILRQKHSVRGTKGKNSETGIPLSILGIDIKNYNFLGWLKVIFFVPIRLISDFQKYDYLVAEMGIDSPKPPKNMAYLLEIIKPEIAVLTNIDYEHSVYFEPLVKNEERFEEELFSLIAKEETSLLKTLPKNSIAVLNLDDPMIFEAGKALKARPVTVSSKDRDADFFLDRTDTSRDSFLVEFVSGGKDYKIKIDQPLPLFFAHSLVLSVAVCSSLGIDISESISVLKKKFSLPPGRASIFEGIKGTAIIDSSYNSSFKAASGMLGLLSVLGKGQRRVAIVGDMREQGKVSEMLHKSLAKVIAENSDYAILIGPQVRNFVSPILRENFKFPHKNFDTYSGARDFILDEIKEGDIILVKGSQNTLFLERVVELLLKNKNDIKKLARRGFFWEKIRQNTP